MTTYDAVFLAVAVAALLGPVPGLWWSAMAPMVAWVVAALANAPLAFPIAAGVFWLAAPRAAPVAFILAVPSYQGGSEVLRAAALWVAATFLMGAIGDRLPEDEEMRPRLRGAPLCLVACAVLYLAFQPLAYAFR